MNKKTIIIISIIAVLLIGALAFLGIRLSQANKANEEMVQLFELEKEEMENEYSTFATQYDEMQILISNDSLVAQLEREKLRTQQLLEELRATKASNAAEIARLKKELKTVRTVMRSYIVQIDSLNTLNKKLTADAAAARREAAESRKHSEKLSKEVEELSGQVAAGAVIKARGLKLEAYNSSDKVTDRSSRVTYMLATLVLSENDLAPRGPVRVYIRVKSPDGILLVNSTQKTFEVNGEPMICSASREVDYQGKDVELGIYLNEIPEFVKGIYTVEAYTAQGRVGSAELMLR